MTSCCSCSVVSLFVGHNSEPYNIAVYNYDIQCTYPQRALALGNIRGSSLADAHLRLHKKQSKTRNQRRTQQNNDVTPLSAGSFYCSADSLNVDTEAVSGCKRLHDSCARRYVLAGKYFDLLL